MVDFTSKTTKFRSLNGDITVSGAKAAASALFGYDVGPLVRSFTLSDVWSDYSSDDLFSFRSSSKGFVRSV